MRKVVKWIFYIFLLIYYPHGAVAQSSTKNVIARNKLLVSQIKAYQAYMNQFAQKHNIKNYLIKIDHTKNGKHDLFTLDVIFHAFQVDLFKPTYFIIVDQKPVLIHEFEPQKNNEKVIDYIKTKYFSTSDSETENKLKTDSRKQKLSDSVIVGDQTGVHKVPRSKFKIQYVDDSNDQFVDVIPESWCLTFKKQSLVFKTVKTKELSTQ
jgi:hypothetical protein